MDKILLATIILISILLIGITPCLATVNPNDFKPDIGVDSGLAGILGPIIRTVQMVGVFIAAIACVVMGIRYVLSSVEDRAEIKKKLIPYVIGAVIFFGATGILQLIAQVSGEWFGK